MEEFDIEDLTDDEIENLLRGTMPKRKRTGKYNATRSTLTVDGETIRFDSQRERTRYFELKALRDAGKIEGLEAQVRFEIVPATKDDNGKRLRARYYIADFVYSEDGVYVIEDVKGVETAVFRLKRHLMFVRYADQFQSGAWRFFVNKG